jgi:hypothetical protein
MRHLTFNPTHIYKDVLDYVPGFDHKGKKPFVGPWDKNLYDNFLQNTILPNNVPDEEWPYRTIENDFYVWNSNGYRTYEFNEITEDSDFTLALGCSFVEGIGVRITERWDHFFESHFNTKVVNLGKGGCSVSAMSYIGHGWFLAGRPKPKRVIAIWTEPSRDTYIVDNGTPMNYVPTYTNMPTSDVVTHTYNQMYDLSVVIEKFWSNKFVHVYNEFNLLMRALNIPTYNFLLDDIWPNYDTETLQKYLNAPITPINFLRVPCTWHPYVAGADGSHPGKLGHFAAFETIKDTIIDYEQS